MEIKFVQVVALTGHRRKPRNRQTFKLNFSLVKENPKRLFTLKPGTEKKKLTIPY